MSGSGKRQWAEGTTALQYLADLRRAVLHPAARLMVYHRGGEDIATAVVATDEILSIERQDVGSLPALLVVYAVERVAVASGYQFSSLDQLNLPEEVLWLN